ncbi:MAG: rhomboid family intramembrane serine protease [Actinomycetota bacterium]|nr:rhomboid family intramembrane serine protease [Actinomycetota bacterium]
MKSPGPDGQPDKRGDRPAPGGTEPPFDPTSWTGALIVMGVVVAVVWVIQIVNSTHGYSLDRFGLKPRRIDGLWGVLTQPFLHTSYGHLLSNTAPLAAIGWVLLLSGVRTWLTVTAVVLIVGGLATWLLAPSGLIVGASGLIFGWLGYLIARAYFSRRIRWIVVAIGVLFFFGTLLTSVLPSYDSHESWQSHACGFVSGILAGALLHPRRARPPTVPKPAAGPLAG